MAVPLNFQRVSKSYWRLVSLNNKTVCKLCFSFTCQVKKFSKEFFQRSFENGVIMSHDMYECI